MNQNIKQIKSKSALAAYLFEAHENWDPHKNERNDSKFHVKYKKSAFFSQNAHWFRCFKGKFIPRVHIQCITIIKRSYANLCNPMTFIRCLAPGLQHDVEQRSQKRKREKKSSNPFKRNNKTMNNKMNRHNQIDKIKNGKSFSIF